MKFLVASMLFLLGLHTSVANTQSGAEDYLIQLKPEAQKNGSTLLMSLQSEGTALEALPLNGWYKISAVTSKGINKLKSHNDVAYVQKNYKLSLKNTFLPSSEQFRKEMLKTIQVAKADDPFPFPFPFPGGPGGTPQDNPDIPAKILNPGFGTDPLFDKQWGMKDNNVQNAWNVTTGIEEMVVAVIDTGVDYTHEDLVENLWRNPNEIPDNNVDDDGNGFVDDIIGWDFVQNDNKPFDLSAGLFEMLLGGGNPGHGTHCAGNVAARGGNGKGVAGVAPNVRIMALRFLSEKGQGTTADAVKAVKYAVDNGARVLSNSWGGNGEDPNEAAENKALRDVIQYSMDRGTLFVAAAGNGDQQGIGFSNDTSNTPSYPASYDFENIVSVAAIDVNNQLGKFSNFGQRTVDIGAPGVKVFSTTVGSKYSDIVINIPGLIEATWDGTSMATPHVAGAAALYWSKYPNKSWSEVKSAILGSATPIPALQGQVLTGAKLNVDALLQM